MAVIFTSKNYFLLQKLFFYIPKITLKRQSFPKTHKIDGIIEILPSKNWIVLIDHNFALWLYGHFRWISLIRWVLMNGYHCNFEDCYQKITLKELVWPSSMSLDASSLTPLTFSLPTVFVSLQKEFHRSISIIVCSNLSPVSSLLAIISFSRIQRSTSSSCRRKRASSTSSSSLPWRSRMSDFNLSLRQGTSL